MNDHPLYWSYSNDPLVQLSLSMTSCTCMSYDDVIDAIPSTDPITILIIMYTMLRVDGRIAYFYVHEGTLFLYTDMGFVGIDLDIDGVDDDIVDDPSIMYPLDTPDRERLIYIADTIFKQLPFSIE